MSVPKLDLKTIKYVSIRHVLIRQFYSELKHMDIPYWWIFLASGFWQTIILKYIFEVH